MRDAVHAEQKVWGVSALRPILETVEDGSCGPADVDVAWRRGPVEDIKRALFEVSVFKGIKYFPGDGVAGAGVFHMGTELR